MIIDRLRDCYIKSFQHGAKIKILIKSGFTCFFFEEEHLFIHNILSSGPQGLTDLRTNAEIFIKILNKLSNKTIQEKKRT